MPTQKRRRGMRRSGLALTQTAMGLSRTSGGTRRGLTKRKVSSVQDERYQLVDIPATSIPANQPGAPSYALKYIVGASPRNLRATTLGDELRLATQGRARVFGISLKDRAAILPAGQAANAAFWIDNASGQFTTSTYYMEHLPEWARVFQHERPH